MSTCNQSSVQNWQDCGGGAEGLLPYPGFSISDGINSLYHTVAVRNNPTGNANFVSPCEASLRARGLIYYKKNPGDCGAPLGVPGFGSGQIVGLSGQAASGVIGGIGAAGVLSGPATLGIGAAVSTAVAGIEAIFAHHAQAVRDEQATICAVANYFNPLCKALDNAVMSGQITPDQGITYMRQITLQAINGLQSIYKKCNAACYFQGYLRAHADFAASFYPAVSPNGPGGFAAQAPGTAPSTFGNPPGAVQDAGGIAPIRSTADPHFQLAPAGPGAETAPTMYAPAISPNRLLPSGNVIMMPTPSDYLNLGYNQQTGQSAQAADVPSIPLNWTTILIAAILIIAAVMFL